MNRDYNNFTIHSARKQKVRKILKIEVERTQQKDDGEM